MHRIPAILVSLLLLFAGSQALADIAVPTFGSRGAVPAGLTETFSGQLRTALSRVGLRVSPAELITSGIAGSLDPAYTALIAELDSTRYAISGELAVTEGQRQAPFVVNLLIVDVEQGRQSDVISRPFALDTLRSVTRELAEQVMEFTDQSQALPAGDAGLFVESEPTGAELLINGLLVGDTAAPDLLQLAAGRYRLELRKEGFLPEMRVEELRSGSTRFVHVNLTPISGGSILVTSSPRANLFIGDELLGATPLTVPARTGIVQVRLEQTGFRSQTVPVLVRNRRVSRLEVNLTAEREPLIYWDEAAGERVFLNGRFQAEPLARTLRPGLLEIEVRRNDGSQRFSVIVPLTGAYKLDLDSEELLPRGTQGR